MDQSAKAQQDNNQLLLNAIQQKFISKTAANSDGKYLDSTQLKMPALRVPTNAKAVQKPVDPLSNEASASTSPLNKFLISQLRQNQINGLSEGFKLPQLKAPTTDGTTTNSQNFNIPLLNRLSHSLTPQVIENGVRDLKINTDNESNETPTKLEPSSPLIDLTMALINNANATSMERPAASKIQQARTANKTGQTEFNIPYIDCDRSRSTKNHLDNMVDEFCVMDVTNVKYNHQLATPSGLGNTVCMKDKDSSKRCFQCAATVHDQLHLKLYRHSDYGTNVKRFRFDTKSPDDLVKESLNKYQRVPRHDSS